MGEYSSPESHNVHLTRKQFDPKPSVEADHPSGQCQVFPMLPPMATVAEHPVAYLQRETPNLYQFLWTNYLVSAMSSSALCQLVRCADGWLVHIVLSVQREAMAQGNIMLKTGPHSFDKGFEQCLIWVLHNFADATHNLQAHWLMFPDAPIRGDARFTQKLFQVMSERSQNCL